MPGELLTRWTIRLGLLLYVACLHLELLDTSGRSNRLARAFWTVGCGLVWLHTGLAFHFHHLWSLTHAWQHTAERTDQLLGIRVGAGVVFNLLFAAVWTIDAGSWWLVPQARAARPFWIAALLHGYLFFIAVNGAVVFEPGPTRWFGVAFSLTLLGLLLYRWIPGKNEPPASL